MNSFYINNKQYNLNNNLNIIQFCEFVGIDIPRFCFHEKLSVAGNCRMCLVEVSGSNKPVASCAMVLSNNMKVLTNTKLVKKAREGILEFILLNHPLDCPICDQGGECDLQDQSLIFGNDRGRFYEFKRSVKDKNCGPLIKTIMTRCIHCTRCVRFFEEIAGIKTFGIIGRGNKMEISNFLDKNINSEISGNVIDLCPVGALTSKPFSFVARPWELNTFNTIDLNDLMNVNVRVDLRDLKILRILPRINNKLNEFWISDITRFFFDGLTNNRLLVPYYKLKNSTFIALTWLDFFLKIRTFINNKKFTFFFGNFIDAETCLLLKNFCNKYGNFSILTLNNFLKNADFRLYFRFGYDIDFLYKIENILFVNINLRLENPLLNIRIKNLIDKNKIKVFSIGSCFNYNFFSFNCGKNFNSIIDFIKGKNILNFFFIKKKSFLFLINRDFFNFNLDLKIIPLIKYFKNYNENFFFSFINFNNTEVLISEFNLGNSINNFNDLTLKEFCLKNYFLYCLNTDNFFFNILNKTFYSLYQGHNIIDNLNLFFDFLLPSVSFFEKNATFINFFGLLQRSKIIIFPAKHVRSDFKILTLIFNLFFKFKGLTYNSIRNFFYKYNFKNISNIYYNFINYFSFNNFIKFCNFNFDVYNTNIYRINQLVKSSLILFSCYKNSLKIYSNFF